jgi:hypothetical protein
VTRSVPTCATPTRSLRWPHHRAGAAVPRNCALQAARSAEDQPTPPLPLPGQPCQTDRTR